MGAELSAAREEVCSELRVSVEAAVGAVHLYSRPRVNLLPPSTPMSQPPRSGHSSPFSLRPSRVRSLALGATAAA
eukprot:14136359-Alexandrium_andersonii.AAC.1